MRKYILFLSLIIIFAGCGASGGPTPYGSTAVFNPASISLQGNTADAWGWAPATITVTVKDVAGKELYNARLHIIFSVEKYPSQTVLADNGLSITDLVTLQINETTFESLLHEHVQDTNNAGNVLLNMRILGNAGLDYSGKLLVYDEAGTLLTTADITVTSI
jgi:hypothetical protein